MLYMHITETKLLALYVLLTIGIDSKSVANFDDIIGDGIVSRSQTLMLTMVKGLIPRN